MSPRRIIGLVVLVTGILVLVYGGFSYTKKTHEGTIGSLELSVKQKKTVYIPIWVGIVMTVSGGALIFLKKKGD